MSLALVKADRWTDGVGVAPAQQGHGDNRQSNKARKSDHAMRPSCSPIRVTTRAAPT
jgi:hypothetical protein